MRTLQIWLGLAAFTFHGLAADFLSPAAQRHPLKNFDARQPSPSFNGLTTRAPVATFPAHAQREIDVQVDFDEATGSAKLCVVKDEQISLAVSFKRSKKKYNHNI